jgi:hypothetical protein
MNRENNMLNMNVHFDSKPFEKQIERLGLSMPTIARRMMNRVSSEIKKEAKRNIHSRTGDLKKSIRYNMNKDFTGIIKAQKYYSWWVENGAVIEPRKKKVLRFKINGEWKAAKAVTIPPRPFLKPAIDKYFGGAAEQANTLMDGVLQQAIDKLEEQGK